MSYPILSATRLCWDVKALNSLGMSGDITQLHLNILTYRLDSRTVQFTPGETYEASLPYIA
jgi:hypothetical protein